MNKLEITQAILHELMEKYGNYLTRTAYLLLKDQHLAEEVVQDVFVKAYQQAHQLKAPNKIKFWLTSIVYNESRSHMRKWAFKNVFARETSQLPEQLQDTYQPEVALIKTFESKNLSEAILKLSQRHREVISLYYYNELTINEISKLIQTNENTVKSRLSRARTDLKKILNEGNDLE